MRQHVAPDQFIIRWWGITAAERQMVTRLLGREIEVRT